MNYTIISAKTVSLGKLGFRKPMGTSPLGLIYSIRLQTSDIRHQNFLKSEVN